MIEYIPEPAALAFVLLGALVAGFITGFAGFGTGLVASGLWFHALPAALVPPLVALSSVAAQLVGLATVRPAFEWGRARPYLLGGVLGVPVGVAALGLASPDTLRLAVGLFLAAYAGFQLRGLARRSIGAWGGSTADGASGLPVESSVASPASPAPYHWSGCKCAAAPRPGSTPYTSPSTWSCWDWPTSA
jgi:hypothetical protein